MSVNFSRSKVLITGASSGIGREMARQLASRASSIVLVARRIDRLRSLKLELEKENKSVKIYPYECDLTDINQIKILADKIEEEVGPIDILINNAGMGDFSPYEETSWSKTEKMLNLNIHAPAYLTHRFIGSMVNKRSGGILNVGSLVGTYFFPGFSAYVGSKFFINGFTESLRAEYSSSGVTISQLCPGPVKTEFEDMAAEGTSIRLPGFINISASTCASIAIRDFEKGVPVIRPGIINKFFYRFYGFGPLGMRRFCASMIWKLYKHLENQKVS